jgi:outer membrane receptor protein involved in Fe transport
MKMFALISLGVWAACVLGMPAYADGFFGDVSGSVVEASGAPIIGARIDFASGETAETAISDGSGHFRLTSIPASTYSVEAEAKGFAPLTARLVQVNAAAVTTVTLEMIRVSTGNIASLGSVTINGRKAMSTAAAPSVILDPQSLAAFGIQNLAGDLAQQIALTMTRPAGGAPGLPQTASLRGPDPSETLIDVDGHVMNNANTGDFDLELLDPSEFSNIQVVYGVGPASLLGANTQGGTIDFHTLEPTSQDHGLLRLSVGSFGTSGYTLQTTGTTDQRVGYALSFHHYYSAGAVNDYLVTYRPNPNLSATEATEIGSAINASSMLGKLRYSFGRGDGFVEASYRSTTAYRDLSAPLSFPNDPAQVFPGASFTAFPGASAFSISPAWSLDMQAPLGARDPSGIAAATVTLRHLTSLLDQTANGIPPGSNPYLLSDRDVLSDNAAEYNRNLTSSVFSLLFDLRTEDLRLPNEAPFSPGVPHSSQTQRSYAARYEWSPTAHLHYSAAAYLSDYSTFGRSTDPRLAVVWTPTANSVIRASFGTGFRSPLLTELAINQGLTAEHTSEYEIGYEHRFGDQQLAPTAEVDAYHTNLRDPIFFVPNPNQSQGQFSFIKNLANVVYSGVEIRADKPLSAKATLHASYGIDIAYPINDPFAFDPSAPNVVSGQQFQGIPPHKALLSVDGRGSAGFAYGIGAGYESSNNELNRPAYWLFNASVGQQIRNTQLALSAQNLTNQFADKFTLMGLGTSYPTPGGPAPTNAYSLPGLTLGFTITQHV